MPDKPAGVAALAATVPSVEVEVVHAPTTIDAPPAKSSPRWIVFAAIAVVIAAIVAIAVAS
jgi:hypothetical protein